MLCKLSFLVLWLSIGLLQTVTGQGVGPGIFRHLFGSSSGRPIQGSEEDPSSPSSSESQSSSECPCSQADETPHPGVSQRGPSSVDSGNGSQDLESKAARFGVPSGSNLNVCESYILSYDCRLKHSNWVLQHLTSEDVANPIESTRGRPKHHLDTTLHKFFRAVNEDYLRSGFTRGRMCPSLDDLDAPSDRPFCSSDIAPQLLGLNRGPWNKLEEYVDYLAARSKNMYVMTGTAYLPVKIGNRDIIIYEVIGDNQVSTPTHFYKVWIREDQNGDLSMEAFLLPNRQDMDDTGLAHFRITIDGGLVSLERSTGLIFFDRVKRDKVAKPIDFQLGFIDRLRSYSIESLTSQGRSNQTSAGMEYFDDQSTGSSSHPETPPLDSSIGSTDNLEAIVRAILTTEIQSFYQAQVDLKRSIEENKVTQYHFLDEVRSLVQSQAEIITQLQMEQKTMKDQLGGLQANEADIAQIKQVEDTIRGHVSSELQSLKESQRNSFEQLKQEQNSLKALMLSEMQSLKESQRDDLVRRFGF